LTARVLPGAPCAGEKLTDNNAGVDKGAGDGAGALSPPPPPEHAAMKTQITMTARQYTFLQSIRTSKLGVSQGKVDLTLISASLQWQHPGAMMMLQKDTSDTCPLQSKIPTAALQNTCQRITYLFHYIIIQREHADRKKYRQ
jgi:hypothetical protein